MIFFTNHGDSPMMIKSENGASAVEFALVLPLLLFITFGIIEFSILLYNKAVITNASREGARAGIAYDTYDNGTDDGDYRSPNQGEIETIIATYLDCPSKDISQAPTPPRLINLTGAKLVTVDPIVDDGTYLTVTVNYPYEFLTEASLNLADDIGGNFSGTINLSATTVMRYEEEH